MSKIHFHPSKLWRYINFAYIAKGRIKNLKNFRSNAVNFKIALFNPARHSARYLKTFIYCLCKSLSQGNWEQIKRTKNRNLLGNPITVRCNGEEICLDYLQAALELEFLEKHLHMADVQSILEIGAGYGRTAHVIVSNHTIEEYYIVDLDNCLQLSRSYLQKVLNGAQFSKIHFVSIDNTDLIFNHSFNLCINIDSFGEMDVETVGYYLDYIDEHCKYLYTKNPVCDNLVRPSSRGLSWKTTLFDKVYNRLVSAITRNTVLPEIIDIFDTDAIKAQARQYIQTYRPGTGWKRIADAWAAPWSNYWQVIYTKYKQKAKEQESETKE